jgi:hypothetical protein
MKLLLTFIYGFLLTILGIIILLEARETFLQTKYILTTIYGIFGIFMLFLGINKIEQVTE